MLHVMNLGTAKEAKHRVEIYNLGTDEFVQVNDSIRYICGALGLKPKHRIFRRQSRLGRRQSVHFSRHQKNPRHRLETGADD